MSSDTLTPNEQYLYRSVLTHRLLLPCGILPISRETLASELTITTETFNETFTNLTNLDLLDSHHTTLLAQDILHRPTPETVDLSVYPLIAKTIATLQPHHPFLRLAQALHPALFHPQPNEPTTPAHTQQYVALALHSAATFKCQREPITTEEINDLLQTYTTINHYQTVDRFTKWITGTGKTKRIKNVLDVYKIYLQKIENHHQLSHPLPTTQPTPPQPQSHTMTQGEWKTIFHTITQYWPHAKTTKHTQNLYWEELKKFPATHVQTAIESLYRDKENFPPNTAKITWRIAELLIDPPTWAEVKTILTQPTPPTKNPKKQQRCTYNMCNGNGFIITEHENSVTDCRCRKEHITTLRYKNQATKHPIITAFAKHYIAAGEINELATGNTTVEAQLRTKYDQFTHRIMRSIVYQGLQERHQPGQLPGLDRIINLSKTIFSHQTPTRPTESLTNLLNQINPTPTPVHLTLKTTCNDSPHVKIPHS